MISLCIRQISAILSPEFALPPEFVSLGKYKKSPKIDGFNILELRRMGNALKCAVSLIKEFNLDIKDIPIVFSSYSGEINRCVALLKSLKDEFVSPTSFSLSVLNATPAQAAIIYCNQKEISSISAREGLEYGLLESYLKPFNRVFLINYEEVSKDLENFDYYALGVLLDKDYYQKQCYLEYMGNDWGECKEDIFKSAFYLLQYFNEAEEKTWNTNSRWKWRML
ncbi:beta-ketoacyl synthase chain length factor [Helicobacter pullorum]|uniref:beta-ketoacyl synthase chain length factor n=1 Tax=Helicobacter pullorum TaxID=35818 RepID=UPI00320A1128